MAVIYDGIDMKHGVEHLFIGTHYGAENCGNRFINNNFRVLAWLGNWQHSFTKKELRRRVLTPSHYIIIITRDLQPHRREAHGRQVSLLEEIAIISHISTEEGKWSSKTVGSNFGYTPVTTKAGDVDELLLKLIFDGLRNKLRAKVWMHDFHKMDSYRSCTVALAPWDPLTV